MTRFRAPVRVVAVALAVVTTCLAHTGASARVSAQAEGACADNEGITVVVDFQELGGGVNVRCAERPVTNGIDALDRADVAWEGTLRFPAFVCRIAGLPTPDDDPCANTPPATAFWSYWIAARGGEWCYANVGPTSRTPPPGSIEGWSFALDKAEANIPPPRLAVPAAIPGQSPNAVRSSECTTPELSGGTGTTTTTSTSTTTTTTRPTTIAPAVTTPAPVPGVSAPTSAPALPSNSQPPAVDNVEADGAAASTVATASTTSIASDSSTTVLAEADPVIETTSSRPSQNEADGDSVSSASGDDLDAAPADSLLARDAVGTVDLSDDRRGGGGFGFSSALAIAAIVAVAGAGIFATRRRTRPLRIET